MSKHGGRKSDKPDLIIQSWKVNWREKTLAEIGKELGVTRQHVSKVLLNHGFNPEAGRIARKRHQQEMLKLQKAMDDMEYKKTSPLCAVCKEHLPRGRRLTCSALCAEAWLVLRYILDAELHDEHRVRTARAYLKNPDAKPSNVEWAHRVIEAYENGKPLPPLNRKRWIRRGSAADRFLKQHPEYLAYLPETGPRPKGLIRHGSEKSQTKGD